MERPKNIADALEVIINNPEHSLIFLGLLDLRSRDELETKEISQAELQGAIAQAFIAAVKIPHPDSQKVQFLIETVQHFLAPSRLDGMSMLSDEQFEEVKAGKIPEQGKRFSSGR
ncbi:MAG TPA: hypothetical protein VD999_00720 [Vitreimonas sp.]|nr:hypothetical protein [Vitreimonas sp.]